MKSGFDQPLTDGKADEVRLSVNIQFLINMGAVDFDRTRTNREFAAVSAEVSPSAASCNTWRSRGVNSASFESAAGCIFFR